MMTQYITTTDLAQFGSMERKEAIEILQAWNDSGLPDEFELDNIQIMMNRNSGYIFLTNDDCQVCMLADGKLEMWARCPNCDHEDFLENLMLENETCIQCRENMGAKS